MNSYTFSRQLNLAETNPASGEGPEVLTSGFDGEDGVCVRVISLAWCE